MTRGIFAPGPMTVLVLISTPVTTGTRAICAPFIRISSHEMTGFFVLIGSMTDSPVTDMVWMSSMYISRASDFLAHSSWYAGAALFHPYKREGIFGPADRADKGTVNRGWRCHGYEDKVCLV